MSTSLETESSADARGVESGADGRDVSPVPAYGPVNAALGFALFYVIVDRATPTVVAVVTGALPGVSPSQIGFGLAAVLWFVLAVSVVDQVRCQLAALGVIDDDSAAWRPPSPDVPAGARAIAYAALTLAGGAVAAWTFDPAVETAVALIPIVAALDVGAFDLGAFLVMVVFFVTFGVATYALDRLVVGGIRAVLAD